MNNPTPAADGRPNSGRPGGYVSEFTQFMDQYLAEHPEEIQEQRRGWAIWWNRPVDFEEVKKAAEDSVPTDGYYYGPSIPRKPTPGGDGGSAGESTAAPPPQPSS